MSRSSSKYGDESSNIAPGQTLPKCSLTFPRNIPSSSTLNISQSCCRSRPTTPKDVRSPISSYEKFCTPHTCQNLKNSKEPSSSYCSYGVKNDNQDIKPLALDNKPDCRICKKCLPRSQEGPYSLTKETQLPSTILLSSMDNHQKLNESPRSSQAPSNTTFQLPCRRLTHDEPPCAQSLNAIRKSSILKRTECGIPTCYTGKYDKEVGEQNTISLERLPSKHDVGVQTSVESIHRDRNTKGQRSSCGTLTDSNDYHKASVKIPTTTYTSTTWKGSQQIQCECRYPPFFKQFSCTGKITGNCDCCSKK